MIRGTVQQLILTCKKPIKGASHDTIRRWTRAVLYEAGIDLSIFTPHSTRGAATRKVVPRITLDTIMQTPGWSRESTFRKYYLKEVDTKYDFEQALLKHRNK